MSETVRPENSAAVEALSREIQNLDENTFPALRALGENELFRLRGGIADSVELIENKKVKIRTKVSIPTAQHPHINFVGKLLGPRGCVLRYLQETTRTKMAILGTGSTRDEAKEKELLSSGDPKFQHLKQKLHLQIDCLAAPAEAYYNLSHALAEVRKVMLQDTADLPPNPWMPGQMQDMGRGGPSGRGGRPPRGRGSFGGQSSYMAAMNFNNPIAPNLTQGMRGRGGVRGRPWSSRGGPSNGTTQPPVVPPMSSAPDAYANGMEQYSYQQSTGYEQPEYDTSGYEEYSAAFGQNDAWGKISTTDNRGRARVHPYGRPGINEESN